MMITECGSDHGQHLRTQGAGVGAEKQEELLVADADAVVDPWAMVVHFHNATLAEAAVVSPWGLECVASAHDKKKRQHIQTSKSIKTKTMLQKASVTRHIYNNNYNNKPYVLAESLAKFGCELDQYNQVTDNCHD